jgi:hypothetical protein
MYTNFVFILRLRSNALEFSLRKTSEFYSPLNLFPIKNQKVLPEAIYKHDARAQEPNLKKSKKKNGK